MIFKAKPNVITFKENRWSIKMGSIGEVTVPIWCATIPQTWLGDIYDNVVDRGEMNSPVSLAE